MSLSRGRRAPSVACRGDRLGKSAKAAIRDLREGRLACLCTVGLFNEGIDIPSIDTVIMLRPTQSATIFLQQLGRGLRRAPTESRCSPCWTSWDTSGAEPRLRALTGQGTQAAGRLCGEGVSELPAGCEIQFDKMSQKRVWKNVKRQLATTALRTVNEFADYARRSASPWSIRCVGSFAESD